MAMDAGDDSGTEDVKHFSLMHDKGLATEVLLASWNPSKDLLALATADRQVVVHRLNWQRLWAASPESKVTALGWRLDGKILAVGNESGDVALHDVESGAVLTHSKFGDSSIQCLCWAQGHVPQHVKPPELRDRAKRFLPPVTISPAAAPGAAAAGPPPSQETHSPPDPAAGWVSDQRLAVLCVADASGVLSICTDSFYGLGTVDLSTLSYQRAPQLAALRLKDISVLQIAMSASLDNVTVVFTAHLAEAASVVKPAGDPGLFVVTLDTAVLEDRGPELLELAQQSLHLSFLLESIKDLGLQMSKTWTTARAAFDEQIEELRTLLESHGIDETPSGALFGLLVCGTSSPAIQQFLTSSLGEVGLKRLAKQMDSAGAAVQGMLVGQLQPALEHVLLRLGEMRGWAQWRERLHPLGFSASSLDLVVREATSALVAGERTLRLLTTVLAQYRALFGWLLRALRLLGDEGHVRTANALDLPVVNSAVVGAFLVGGFAVDPLQYELRGPSYAELYPAVQPAADYRERLRPVTGLLDEMATLGGFDVERLRTEPLTRQLAMLMGRCGSILQYPKRGISPLITPLGVCMLQAPRPDAAPGDQRARPVYAISHVASAPLRGVCSALAVPGPTPGGGACVALVCQAPEAGAAAETALLRLPEGQRILDVAFYKDATLALLGETAAAEPGGAASSWLALVECPSLSWHRMDQGGEQDVISACQHQSSYNDLGPTLWKQREINRHNVHGPLAISALRGLASILAGHRRILIFDLEDTEDNESE